MFLFVHHGLQRYQMKAGFLIDEQQSLTVKNSTTSESSVLIDPS